MSNVPATQQDVNLNAPEGLEDFGTEDRVMPMLRIDHHENVFVDALSGEKFPELNVILLGLVKQRVLWPAQMKADAESSEPPLCRSYDFHEGHPSPPETFSNGTTQERFPWDATQFEPGSEIVPCSQCPLKDWGSHPTRDAPWCSEQHTFVLVIPQGDSFVPCLFQVQRSGLKPSRQYLSSFANANQPLFTVNTQIKLQQKKFGNNPFSVPEFSRNGAVDEQFFPEFSTMYRSVREYLQTPRRTDEEEQEDSLSTETVEAPAQQAPQTAPQPPQAQAPAPPAEPAQGAPAQAAPAQQAAPQPAQQAAPAPAAPQQTPAPEQAQAAPAAPVEDSPQAAPAAPSIGGQAPASQANPPAAEPQAAPAPEAPAAPASADDDEIPF